METSLIGDLQVIVDIYSRFLFEREVFNRREQAELSAVELCELMSWSQKEAYGDGLDERYLQPYMWTWKPHYYSSDLPYYNFPYAFGLLFGLGLYAIYQQRGAAFVPEYQNLLASTGEDSAANLAARFNIDIRRKDFWAASLKVIEARIDRYVNIRANQGGERGLRYHLRLSPESEVRGFGEGVPFIAVILDRLLR